MKEQPKTTEKKPPFAEASAGKEKRPQHEIELEQGSEPQEGEALDKWIKRIGGPDVEVVKDLTKYSPPREKAKRPLMIDLEGTFKVNDKNIGEYFDKEKIEALLENKSPSIKFIKTRGEYQIKKELFPNPEFYCKEIIVEELKAGRKIVVDRRFRESVDQWKEKLEKEKEEEKKELVSGDEVLWESQGEVQWKEPKKIIEIQEHKGQKFAFFEDSETGIPVDQLRLKESKEEKKKPERGKEPEKKKPEAKKTPTLDEKIEAKKKEIEEIERGYNIYYSPVVQDLLGLYYRKRYKKDLKGLREELKELEKEKEKEPKDMPEKVPLEKAPETMPEEVSQGFPKGMKKKEKVVYYLQHLEKTDDLFNEMTELRRAVEKGGADDSGYEAKKEEWGDAFQRTLVMTNELDESTLKKAVKTREKIRRENKERRKIEKRLQKISEQIKGGPVLGRADLEKEQTRLEKKLKKLK